VFDAVGALGKAFADMVNEDTVHDVVVFFGQLEKFLPVLGDMLTAIGNLDLLNLVGQALTQIGNALSPVLPMIQEFARILGNEVSALLHALQPALNTIGVLIGALAQSLGPLVEALGGLLVQAIQALL